MKFDYTEKWTVEAVKAFSKEKGFDGIDIAEKLSPEVLKTFDKLILSKRSDFHLRFYGFYGEVCDLSMLRHVPSVKKLVVNCIEKAKNVEAIGELQNLTELSVGIHSLDDFSFLDSLPPKLVTLKLEAADSKKLSLGPLRRFKKLKRLHLEGHTKDIEAVGELTHLEYIRLRSITLDSLSFIEGLKNLSSLDLKLGGTKNLSSLVKLPNLKYFEIWQVNKLGNQDLKHIAKLNSLQFLFLQSLPNITKLPSLAPMKSLRKIYLENMKGLRDFSSISKAPALEQFYFSSAMNCVPDDFNCLLKHPTLKYASVGFGSHKRNEELARRFKANGIKAEVAPGLRLLENG